MGELHVIGDSEEKCCKPWKGAYPLNSCGYHAWSAEDDGTRKCDPRGAYPKNSPELHVIGDSEEKCCKKDGSDKGGHIDGSRYCGVGTQWKNGKCTATYEGLVSACKVARSPHGFDWTCSVGEHGGGATC